MRCLLLLLALLLACPAWGGVAAKRMLGVMSAPNCTQPVTGETGDTDNYLSDWSLTGGPCGTIYYTANWDDYTFDWDVRIYADINHTVQLGSGVGSALVGIYGTVHGTVAVLNGPVGTLTVEGTLTR